MIKYRILIVLFVLFFIGMIIAVSTYVIGNSYNYVGVIISASCILLCLPGCFVDNIIDSQLKDKEKKLERIKKEKMITKQVEMKLEEKKLELEKEKVKLESLKAQENLTPSQETPLKKFCRYCGDEIDKSAKVCPLCGNNL